MAIVGWVLALLLGIAVALFSVQNQQAASVNVLGAVYQGIPTWTVILAAAAVGALIVILISLVDRLRWFVTSRHSRKLLVQRENRIQELEQEVMRLRGAA